MAAVTAAVVWDGGGRCTLGSQLISLVDSPLTHLVAINIAIEEESLLLGRINVNLKIAPPSAKEWVRKRKMYY